MIRNLLLIIFLGICVSITGIFTVNDNEIAILKRGDSYTKFSSGIYWHIPLYDEITFVYTNNRMSEKNYEQVISIDNHKYKINYSIVWRVINPIQFVKYTNMNSKQDLNQYIESTVNSKINIIAEDGDLFAVINHISLLSKLNIQKLGIEIDNVSVTSLSLFSNQDSVSISAQSESSNFVIAQKIKESADNQYNEVLKQMQNKNDKFYQLYMKIYQLQHSAKSKDVIPPLESFLVN